jgi:anti-sigma factor RsiW
MNTPDDANDIDRLVDGELDESTRRELLRRLDSVPDGWRRCALAFVEAQEFGQAARAWTRDHAPTRSEPKPVAYLPQRKRAGWLRFAVAASVAGLAFASGFAAGERTRAETVVDRKSTVVEASPTPSELPKASTSAPALASRTAPVGLPEYVRAIWERSGYQVEPRRKLVSLNLDGGRRVTIPVEGVQIQYIGHQTY